MDLNGVEQIQLNAKGGSDNIVVGDLTGTGVTQVSTWHRCPAAAPATSRRTP